VNADVSIKGGAEPHQFATTRWSLILTCARSDATTNEAARCALEELCQMYGQPIFAFICRRGYSMTDAQDLTQDFFVMMTIEGNLLSVADPSRAAFGRFCSKPSKTF
jgi:hypothetical protein